MGLVWVQLAQGLRWPLALSLRPTLSPWQCRSHVSTRAAADGGGGGEGGRGKELAEEAINKSIDGAAAYLATRPPRGGWQRGGGGVKVSCQPAVVPSHYTWQHSQPKRLQHKLILLLLRARARAVALHPRARQPLARGDSRGRSRGGQGQGHER